MGVDDIYSLQFYFISTIVTPISPSPKVPSLKLETCGWFERNSCIPFLSFPVPFPWTILTWCKLAILQLSKYWSNSITAESTVSPSKFISVEIFLAFVFWIWTEDFYDQPLGGQLLLQPARHDPGRRAPDGTVYQGAAAQHGRSEHVYPPGRGAGVCDGRCPDPLPERRTAWTVPGRFFPLPFHSIFIIAHYI